MVQFKVHFWLFQKTFGDFHSDYVDNAEKPKQIFQFIVGCSKEQMCHIYIEFSENSIRRDKTRLLLTKANKKVNICFGFSALST